MRKPRLKGMPPEKPQAVVDAEQSVKQAKQTKREKQSRVAELSRTAKAAKPARREKRQRPRQSAASQGVLAERLQSLRASSFTFGMVGVLVIGALLLMAPISTFVQQQAQIKQLRASLAKSEETVKDAERVRQQWSDPTFVKAQARSRLYFVMPGETQIAVLNDIVLPPDPTRGSSDKLVKKSVPWQEAMLISLIKAGETPAPQPEQKPQQPQPPR